jgi:hypothetical protein
MTINITQEWLYVGIILVLIGIQIYQQAKIKKLFSEATDLWEQMSILTMTVANKFTELDTKFSELKQQVVGNDKKEDIKK